MSHGRMPLFPPACTGGNTLRMPLFDGHECIRNREECQRVCIRNPACPDEIAEVELCVDCDGNLSICVHRPPRPCCAPRRKRCGCDCSPWFK